VNSYLILSSFFLLFNLSYSQINDLSVGTQSEKELLALQYYNQGEFDKALELYEQIYKKSPDIYIYNYYFQCLIELEQYKEAEKLTKQLFKKNPAVFRYQVDLGIVYLRSGDIKNADKTFSEAIKGINATEENYHSLAQYFKFCQLNDYAIKTYEHAILNLPHFKSLYFDLAFLYWQKELYTESFEQYYTLLDFTIVNLDEIQERLQASLSLDKTGKAKKEFRDFALLKVQRSPQNAYYSEMLLWAYLLIEDFKQAIIQAIAMDRRQRADGDIVLNIIPVLISNKQYDLAIQGLEYIVEKGEKSRNYDVARSDLLSVRFTKATSQLSPDIQAIISLERDYKTLINELGLTPNTIFLAEELAKIQAFYLDKPDSAQILLEKAMNIRGLHPLIVARIKLQLADVLLVTNQRWDASLMYSQVERDFMHDTIGFRAKFKNAKFYYYIGEFEYAKSQIDVIRTATSRLIANDAIELSLFISNSFDYDSSWVPLQYYSRAEFNLLQRKHLEAIAILDSLLNIFPYHPVADDALFLKANIFLHKEDYEAAIKPLHIILAQHYFGLLADDAVFLLANIYENKIRDIEKAKELYWQLISDFPGSSYVNEAREKYRSLRSL